MSQNVDARDRQTASRMVDYSDPLASMPATLARLTSQLGERDYKQALATTDDVLRRMQVVRDWLIVEVTRGGEE